MMSDLVEDNDTPDRYARLRLISWWDQDRLAAARVMVVGVGALGNEVLKNLAMLGTGEIHLVDSDRIETSNLTRSILFRAGDRGRPKATVAAEAIVAINPDVRVIPHHADVTCDIGLGLFRDVDVVIGCLDNREARLWVNRCCWKTGTPWIDGGIQELNGVAQVFVPPDGVCYECGMTENDYQLINRRYSCPLLRPDEIQAGRVPTVPTIASIIGGLQTQEALKLLHGLPAAAGQALVFHGGSNQFYRSQLARRDDCLSHEVYDEPLSLPLSAAGTTVRTLLDAVGQAQDTSGGARRLMLDRDLLTHFECVPCGIRWRVMKPRQLVRHADAVCRQCGQIARPHLTHAIESDDDLAEATLQDLGVPLYDMLRVECGPTEHVVLLAGDRAEASPPWQGEAGARQI